MPVWVNSILICFQFWSSLLMSTVNIWFHVLKRMLAFHFTALLLFFLFFLFCDFFFPLVFIPPPPFLILFLFFFFSFSSLFLFLSFLVSCAWTLARQGLGSLLWRQWNVPQHTGTSAAHKKHKCPWVKDRTEGSRGLWSGSLAEVSLWSLARSSALGCRCSDFSGLILSAEETMLVTFLYIRPEAEFINASVTVS